MWSTKRHKIETGARGYNSKTESWEGTNSEGFFSSSSLRAATAKQICGSFDLFLGSGPLQIQVFFTSGKNTVK